MGGFEQKEEAVDVEFVRKVDLIAGEYTHMPVEDIFYIYRWNPGAQYHHSAVAAQAGSDERVQGLIDAKIPASIHGRQTITPTHYRNYRHLSLNAV
jgi:hypothetical protein